MGRCAAALIYEGISKPYTLCLTDDPRIKALIKKQVLREAEEALKGARVLGDPVILASFEGNLQRLRKTLDQVIPAELGDLFNE